MNLVLIAQKRKVDSRHLVFIFHFLLGSLPQLAHAIVNVCDALPFIRNRIGL